MWNDWVSLRSNNTSFEISCFLKTTAKKLRGTNTLLVPPTWKLGGTSLPRSPRLLRLWFVPLVTQLKYALSRSPKHNPSCGVLKSLQYVAQNTKSSLNLQLLQSWNLRVFVQICKLMHNAAYRPDQKNMIRTKLMLPAANQPSNPSR